MLTLNHILLLLILLAFPHGLPDHRFMLQFVLTAPPQDHEPSISSTISLPICEPLSISNYLIQKLANGAPTLHPFFTKFLPSLGHSFHTGAPVSVFVHFSQIISLLLVQTPVFYSHLPLSSPLAACLPFGHTQPMSPLVGALLIIYLSRHRLSLQSTTQVIYHLPSEFVHFVPPLAQLNPGLVVPLTLDPVTRLRPLFLSYILQPRAVLSHPTF
jgi:hypothetical protein